jgi:hypothetical protein
MYNENETYCIECNIDLDEEDTIEVDIEKNIFSDIKWTSGCPICGNTLYELNFAIRKFRLNRISIIDSTNKKYHELINQTLNI